MFQVHIVTVYVKDQDRAREFYTTLLGCEVRVDRTDDAGNRFLEVAPPGGGTRLALALAPPGRAPGGATGITLNADNIEAAYRTLRDRGVSFVQSMTRTANGGARSIFVDQDGNSFVLQQHPHPPGG